MMGIQELLNAPQGSNPWMMLCRIVFPTPYGFEASRDVLQWFNDLAPCEKFRVACGAGKLATKERVFSRKRCQSESLPSDSTWITLSYESEFEAARQRGRIFAVTAEGFNGKGGRGVSLQDLNWIMWTASGWVSGVHAHVDIMSMAVRLTSARGRMRAAVRDFSTTIVPKLIKSYPLAFGVIDVERASEIAFGMEPQFANYEISYQRRMAQRYWECELEACGEILPYLGWVNIISATMLAKLGCSVGRLQEMCLKIMTQSHAGDQIEIACIPTENGGGVITFIPKHFDCPFGTIDGDYQTIGDRHSAKAMYEIGRWWRDSGILL